MPAATTSSLPTILALARRRFRPMTSPHRAVRYFGAVSLRPSHPGHEADEENQGHGRQDQRHAQVALFLFGCHGLESSTNHAGCAGIEPGRSGKGVERGWRRDLPFQTLGTVPWLGGGFFTLATQRRNDHRHEEIHLRQTKTETAHGGN